MLFNIFFYNLGYSYHHQFNMEYHPNVECKEFLVGWQLIHGFSPSQTHLKFIHHLNERNHNRDSLDILT